MKLSDVVLRGTRANQPSFLVAPVGALYFVTDENVIERNAGTSWQTYSPTTPVSGPSSAVDNALARFDGATGRLLQSSLITLTDAGILQFPDNVRQTFNPGANAAGLNVGAQAGNPSALVDGDVWYDSTNLRLMARINGRNVSLLGDWDREVIKTADETVTNSSTYIEDAELFLPTGYLEVNASYKVEYEILYSGNNTTADYKWEWRLGFVADNIAQMLGWMGKLTAAGGADNALGEITNNVSPNNFWGNFQVAVDTVANRKFPLFGQFIFTTPSAFGAGDGQLHYRFAQNSAGGVGTVATTHAGSRFRIKRLFPL